ncbi:hypothetical protein JW992_10870 [candidate division KSB1 bacterium]|nr:hypothetical protein [candidate division KSB1 bacterium]
MLKKCLLHCWVFWLLLAASLGWGQSVQDAVQLWRGGDLDGSADLLRRLVHQNDHGLQAMLLLGQLETVRRNWSDGIEWLDRAEKNGATDLSVPYYRGICYRQRALTRILIWRNADWKAAEKNFLAVIENEPTYGRIWIEYAALQKDREKYYDAVELAEKQLFYHPLQSEAEVYLNYLYEVLLHHEKPKTWLLQRSDYRSRFFLGQTYSREGQPDSAQAIYDALLRDPLSRLSPVPIYLALARLAVQRDDNEGVQHHADCAIDTIHYEIDAELYFDAVKTIFTDDELARYQSLSNLTHKKLFFRWLWERRNPLPGTTPNYRLVEHFRRLSIAEQEYWYDGVRSWFNDPDKLGRLNYPRIFFLNRRFNDKGLVFIRHGEPHDRAFQIGADLPDNESWLYRDDGRHGKLIYHFILDENAVGNNWRLTPGLPVALYKSREEWDPLYQIARVMSPLDIVQREEEIKRKSETSVTIGLNSDRHTWGKKVQSIAIPYYLATFFVDRELNRTECYFGLEMEQVFGDTTAVADSDTVYFQVAALDSSGKRVFLHDRPISALEIKESSDSLGLWIGQVELLLPPQPLRFTLHCRLQQADRVGGYFFPYPAKILDSAQVQISDILLASSIVESEKIGEFSREGLRILPQPDRFFDRNKPVYVYYELYNLPLDARGQVLYQLEYRVRSERDPDRGLLRKIGDLFSGSRERIYNRVERSSRQSTIRDYLALDLGRLSPGSYELQVGVDLDGKEPNDSARIRFRLRE